MNVDCAFQIGKTHKICQDYAEICSDNVVVVSDGCSSSPNTDFGARVLTKLFAEKLVRCGSADHLSIIKNVDSAIAPLYFDSNSLDATILYAVAHDLDDEGQPVPISYDIVAFGDGVIAKIHDDGIIDVTILEYPSGAPNYLSYQLLESRYKQYEEKFSLLRKTTFYRLHPDGKMTDELVKEDSTGQHHHHFGSNPNIKAIALMTDGIQSYYRINSDSGTSKVPEVIPLNNVLLSLLDFKGFQGEFVQRRFQKFQKDCERKGWLHSDDVSLGVLCLK